MPSSPPVVKNLKSLPHDIQAFLQYYPDTSRTTTSSVKAHPNLDFYNDKIPMRPDNVTISQVHSTWFGRYDLLESRHGFIQWLFPIREHGVNPQASPLSAYEVSQINDEMRGRIRKSLDLMLDFYGMKVVDEETCLISRTSEYRHRYENLVTSTHNFLRISRILKSLSEFGLEKYNVPILLFILMEQGRRELDTRSLSRSLDNYWSWCIRDDAAREFITSVVMEVRSGKMLNFTEYEAILQSKVKSGNWHRIVTRAGDDEVKL